LTTAYPPLTARQRGVLNGMAGGLTNRQIANLAGLREQSVKNQVSLILLKLGAQNRTKAVVIGARLGLVRVREKHARGEN